MVIDFEGHTQKPPPIPFSAGPCCKTALEIF